MRLATAYTVPIGTTSAVNARVTPVGIHEVRVAVTNDCYITIGTAPVATLTTGSLMRASTSGEVFTLAAGDQVAVIGAAAGGVCSITEMTY